MNRHVETVALWLVVAFFAAALFYAMDTPTGPQHHNVRWIVWSEKHTSPNGHHWTEWLARDSSLPRVHGEP